MRVLHRVVHTHRHDLEPFSYMLAKILHPIVLGNVNSVLGCGSAQGALVRSRRVATMAQRNRNEIIWVVSAMQMRCVGDGDARMQVRILWLGSSFLVLRMYTALIFPQNLFTTDERSEPSACLFKAWRNTKDEISVIIFLCLYNLYKTKFLYAAA